MKRLFLFISVLLIYNSLAFADTEVSNLIAEDTTWTLENSPYILLGKVGIAQGITLTIEPGVQVKSAVSSKNTYPLVVNGKIIAKGNNSNPIIFTTLEENPSWYKWEGIEIKEEGSVFEWCEFSWAKMGFHSGIVSHGTNPTLIVKNSKFFNIGLSVLPLQSCNCIIQNNYFTNCGYGNANPENTQCISVGDGSKIIGNTIENNNHSGISGRECEISGNKIIHNTGFGIDSTNCNIFDNIILDNGMEGIISTGGTLTHNLISNNLIGVETCNSVINYNNIFNNAEYNILVPWYLVYDWHPCNSDTDAISNWWGSTDENVIKELIYDNDDDWELGKVNYIPWLSLPNPDVPTTSSTTSTTTTISPPCTSEQIYGEQSEETELLRHFRDNVLSKTPEGQELISLYYEWSPVLVRAMEGDEEFKEEIREMIEGILPLIRGEAE